MSTEPTPTAGELDAAALEMAARADYEAGIRYFGLKVVEGDFTLKSGRKSSLILVPVDGHRLLKLAGQAFEAALTRPDTNQEGT